MKAFANIYSIAFVLIFTCAFFDTVRGVSRVGSYCLRRAGAGGLRGNRWVQGGLGAYLTLLRLKDVGGRKEKRERGR